MDWVSAQKFPVSTLHNVKKILFLQGIASQFFSALGYELGQRGHSVKKINFNGGDRLFWRLPDAVDYRDTFANWPGYLAAVLLEWEISDVIMFGDCRPYHFEAIKVARALGVRTFIFEEGYLRPNWLTMETRGTNGFSALPTKIEDYTSKYACKPAWQPEKVQADMRQRSIEDVVYTAALMGMRFWYTNYKHYRPYHPLVEYASGARRLCHRFLNRKQRARDIAQLADKKYFVWPLQIEVDSQLTVHCTFENVEHAIDTVLGSFAKSARADDVLVLTEHPLETSPRNWRRYVMNRLETFGLADRVKYLVNGTPDPLLMGAQGVVVINSTIGQRALELGVPVIALGTAVFDMRGLTFQDSLDDFWTKAKPADPGTVAAYRYGVVERTQINGGIYSKRGIELAVENAVKRIEDKSSALPLQEWQPTTGAGVRNL